MNKVSENPDSNRDEEDLPAYLFQKPSILPGKGRRGLHWRTKSSMPDELNKIKFMNSPM